MMGYDDDDDDDDDDDGDDDDDDDDDDGVWLAASLSGFIFTINRIMFVSMIMTHESAFYVIIIFSMTMMVMVTLFFSAFTASSSRCCSCSSSLRELLWIWTVKSMYIALWFAFFFHPCPVQCCLFLPQPGAFTFIKKQTKYLSQPVSACVK